MIIFSLIYSWNCVFLELAIEHWMAFFSIFFFRAQRALFIWRSSYDQCFQNTHRSDRYLANGSVPQGVITWVSKNILYV
jgi:hypothetical protein